MVPIETWPCPRCDLPLVKRRPPHQTRSPQKTRMGLRSLWILSPQAGQGAGSWQGPGGLAGCPGRPGSEVTLRPVTSALAHPRAVHPHAGSSSLRALRFSEWGGRDQLGCRQAISLPPGNPKPSTVLSSGQCNARTHPSRPGPQQPPDLSCSCCPLLAGWVEMFQWRPQGPGNGKNQCHEGPPPSPREGERLPQPLDVPQVPVPTASPLESGSVE